MFFNDPTPINDQWGAKCQYCSKAFNESFSFHFPNQHTVECNSTLLEIKLVGLQRGAYIKQGCNALKTYISCLDICIQRILQFITAILPEPPRVKDTYTLQAMQE